MAAAQGQGRDDFRASHADREQAIEVLKDAFAQGRLDEDEFDARVGQAFASRTYAELAAVTADIPGGSAAAPPSRQPARARNRTPRSRTARDVAIGSGLGLTVMAVILLGGLLQYTLLLFPVAFVILAAVVSFAGINTAATASQKLRSRGQLPPRPGQGGQAPEEPPEVQQPGHDPALPPDRPGQARADLQSDSSRPGRPRSSGRGARTPRGIRPAPGAV